ncbi:MAG TPA: hypothetical protein VFU62_09280 [Hanamia sp.]|nr:hypothetical protein [Hanamia sp.]
MLNGFETYTESLSEDELAMIPFFIRGFENKIGSSNAITNKKIVERMKVRFPGITEVRVRKIINYLRNNDLVPGLVASSMGYYITHDEKEIERYIESLAGRESEIRRVKKRFEEFLYKLKNKQQGEIIYGQ